METLLGLLNAGYTVKLERVERGIYQATVSYPDARLMEMEAGPSLVEVLTIIYGRLLRHSSV